MIVYVRVVEGAKSHVRWHQCWDAERFIASQREELAKKKITIAVISEEEYRAEKWPTAPGRSEAA